MKQIDMPVQMICLCNEKGDISPVRFRLEDKNGIRHIYKVRKIVTVKHSELAGIDAYIFQCVVQIHASLTTVWLRYTVMSRKWILLALED